MRTHSPGRLLSLAFLAPFVWLMILPPDTLAQGQKPQFNIYGFAMLDMGYDFRQNDPAWFDVLRPSKFPSYSEEFGKDGRTYAGVRQSRLGVKASFPTELGAIKTIFEFEMFGVGVDAGQTTIRLRHAFGELGQFGAGQTWSVFMDADIFPNSFEYWGPSGMVFFRNVQVRWMPIQGETRMAIALERPGASADGGIYKDRVELDNITPRFPLPDLTAEYRLGRPWGYVELAGILRYMAWDDNLPDQYDLSGSAVGWGLNLSSNVKISKDILRLQLVYGAGIENYMNEGPADVGAETNPGDPRKPLKGKALPLLGFVAMLDHVWNERWGSTIGYSHVNITPSNAQTGDAFKLGHYMLANVNYTPVPNFMAGCELQVGQRVNNSDGWKVADVRIQFGAKYSFSQLIGG
jgi:hypothetical protein